VLAVDCDPNPGLAEEFGLDSGALERFDHSGLRPVPGTLELAREPTLVELDAGVSLLGGPPSAQPLADAVARGIAGVLLARRFDAVVTDLGAGPEFAEMAVGGVLNPADVCIVLASGSASGRLAAERIEAACARRGVTPLRVAAPADAAELAARLLGTAEAPSR
jgi:hypothetical protein